MRRMLVAVGVMLMTAGTYAQDAANNVAVGQPAPDFAVTGIDGKRFKLSDKTKAGKNVALMFSRAHW